jgi:hypothetical protein
MHSNPWMSHLCTNIYMHACIYTYIHTRTNSFKFVVQGCIHAYIYTYMHTCVQAFKSVGQGTMSELHTLNIGWCVGLGDDSLHAIGTGCPKMQRLYVLGNVKM